MKKILLALGLAASVMTSCASAAATTTMYAPDGRTTTVYENEVAAWQNVGWYTSPVATMYAPDGSHEVVFKQDVPAWQSVGWYTRPVVTMYAPDGRSVVVYEDEVSAWQSVGWYIGETLMMYAPDGREIRVFSSEVPAWESVGWYRTPVKAIYGPDGRAVVVSDDWNIVTWENSGLNKIAQLDKSIRNAYSAALYDLIYSEYTTPNYSVPMFSFAYIDDDDIPEVVCSRTFQRTGQAIILTYHKGEVHRVSNLYDSGEGNSEFGSYGQIGYYEKEGVFVSRFYPFDDDSQIVYKMQDGDAVPIYSYDSASEEKYSGEINIMLTPSNIYNVFN